MGYTFERGGFGYGRVVGKWREHEIEVSVNKDYDSLRGLTGFIVNSRTMNSAVGVLAGITNFTSVKIKHNKPIRSLDLDKRTFLDDHLTLYLPECNRITGLPLLKPEDLVRNIDSRIDQHKAVEK